MSLIRVAILPYFPYSRQSKKKSHRGAITARMLANLLHVAGINHVITVDLHASQMQGFFRCPVDNLHAEPLLARWIRLNVKNWKEAVCVSKNAGGTKRVTSLADALKLNFGMVTTDKKRGGGMTASMIMSRLDGFYSEPPMEAMNTRPTSDKVQDERPVTPDSKPALSKLSTNTMSTSPESHTQPSSTSPKSMQARDALSRRLPLRASTQSAAASARSPRARANTMPYTTSSIDEDAEADYTDERARDITQGRLVHGHIVPDDYPSPTQSAMSTSMILERPEDDPMELSLLSRASSFFTSADPQHSNPSVDAGESSDEEEKGFKDTALEQMITLVGDVRGRTVFLVDDMIDKAGSWIAAAETVVKRGGAKKVYCLATHGLFGGDALAEMEACDCINTIVVTNSFPIPEEKLKAVSKLVVLDLSNLLAEAIRRNHYGESISALYSHSDD